MEEQSTGWVLIMDDDEDIRIFAGTAAALLGYEVILAADGEEAVEFFRQSLQMRRPFDAVILDLSVPGGKGAADIIGELRELDPAVRAIISTADIAHPAFMSYRAYGFSGALGKPYRVQQLADSLAAALGKGQGQRIAGRRPKPRTAPAVQSCC
jgi:DNA-binding NtrC family response regulator